ncbi:uncharacterized protein LOC134834209 [Culicoides brevitarsis]|uniref:uncharacterized protein LOC134834209 n=1 Tax=Culicoides brevitarsis TaxID=469753 RepID=UPI00307C1B21
MGGQQSKQPRSVSYENDSTDGLIDISDDVVNRLKGQRAEQRKDAKSQETSRKPEVVVPHVVPTTRPVAAGSAPAFFHYAEPSLTSMQVRKEKEAELKANDDYWKQTLAKREAQFKQNDAAMEKEYNDTIDNVKKLFENAPATYQPAPCQEFRAKLIACYKQHSKESLQCAQEVKDFTTCVDKNRVQLLDSKYAASDKK